MLNIKLTGTELLVANYERFRNPCSIEWPVYAQKTTH